MVGVARVGGYRRSRCVDGKWCFFYVLWLWNVVHQKWESLNGVDVLVNVKLERLDECVVAVVIALRDRRCRGMVRLAEVLLIADDYV